MIIKLIGMLFAIAAVILYTKGYHDDGIFVMLVAAIMCIIAVGMDVLDLMETK